MTTPMGIRINRSTAVVASAFGMMDVVFILEAGTVVTPPAADTSDCGLRKERAALAKGLRALTSSFEVSASEAVGSR